MGFDKLSLLLVVVFAFVFLGERPSTREWLGIPMVCGGVLVLALKKWNWSRFRCGLRARNPKADDGERRQSADRGRRHVKLTNGNPCLAVELNGTASLFRLSVSKQRIGDLAFHELLSDFPAAAAVRECVRKSGS